MFFSSYAYERTVFERWMVSGVVTQLERRKIVVREGKDSSVDRLLEKFAESATAGGGALLSAVVGGKLSEGINFSDDMGRAVVVVGMPFPNPYDIETKEVVQFVAKQVGEEIASQYLEDVCMKAVNQSIGRCIRHRDDYASIILLETRYTNARVQAKLPQWIAENVTVASHFGAVMRGNAQFFRARQASPS